MDMMMLGMIGESTQNRDQFITKQVSRHLFSEHPPHEVGEDLMSLNIQRGRDHGIPGQSGAPPRRRSGVTRLQWARVQVFQKGPLFPKKTFKKQRRANFGPPTALGPRALHALHALLYATASSPFSPY